MITSVNTVLVHNRVTSRFHAEQICGSMKLTTIITIIHIITPSTSTTALAPFRHVIDEYGVVRNRYTYDPFGEYSSPKQESDRQYVQIHRPVLR